jgi:SAM-dependent methyltransferase
MTKETITNCNFCNGTDSKELYEDNEHLISCLTCGLVFTKVQMNVEGMKDFYGKDYFINSDSVQKGYEHYFDSRNNIWKTFSRRMNIIEKHFKNPGKVLDIGCAAGFFLEVAKKRGWEVRGVDISKLCTEYAKNHLGITVDNELFANVEYRNENFDLITMWDYLEHSIRPKEDMEKAYKLLENNGLLVIAVPDVDSFPSRFFKSNWIGIKLDEHFYYFSRKILVKKLEEIGFDVIMTGYAGKYVSTSIAADRLIYYNKLFFLLFGKIIKRLNFSFYCNPFDISFIIARKKI